MIAITSKCLSADELQQLLDGQLDVAKLESASLHIDDCDVCQNSIDRLGLASKSQAIDRDVDPLHAEAECHFAIYRLLHQWSRSVSLSSADQLTPESQFGPYRILGHLGRGGMGTVCLAEHERLKRRCAIKLLPPGRVGQAGWLERFEREMAAVASLEHPGIVRASDAGTHDGWHYLVMEYLDGLDLAHVAAAIGKLDIADACEIVRQAAIALAHVHGSGLVHRDVKPSNLMLTRNGTVKLLDLGLVLAGDDPLSGDDRLTTVGHMMGTLPAMSPEQLLDSRRVDAATDVYSLGATLFRLIGGRWPFPDEGGMAARVLAITSQSAPRLSSARDIVEKGLDDLVAAMMQRIPKDRPTADQVAERIAAWTDGADLKTLIRQAEHRSVDVQDSSPQRPSFVNVSAAEPPPPINRRHKGLAGGFRAIGLLAAGMVLATVIIQIRTENGDVIVKTDGKQTEVEVVPDKGVQTKSPADSVADLQSTPSRLYLGKDLSHWMDVFQREQQIESIGQAMRAVELLSRDTFKREQAASMTLQLANEYGTMQIDESPDQSGATSDFIGHPSPVPERYMGYLAEVFPAYLLDPGLQVIDEQLANGNEKAKVAAIKMLEQYLTGVYISSRYPERQRSARSALKSFAATRDGHAQLTSLLKHLGEAFESLERNSISSSELTSGRSHSMVAHDATYARSTAWSMGVDLLSATGNQIEPPRWIADHVIDRIGTALNDYRIRPVDPETGEDILQEAEYAMGGGMGGMGGGIPTYVRPDWIVAPDLLLAALEMRREGRLDFPTTFAVDVMTHPTLLQFGFGYGFTETFVVLSQIDAAATEMIVAKVEKKLSQYESELRTEQVANPALGGINQDQLFSMFGAVYAENVKDPAIALNRVEKLQKAFYAGSPDAYSPLTAVIEQLQERRKDP